MDVFSKYKEKRNMNNDTTTLRTIEPKMKVGLLNNKTVHSGLLVVALVSSIFYAGFTLGARKTEPDPSNTQCRKFALETPKYYRAQMGAMFGEQPPTGALTKEQLNALGADCDKNINVYTFQVKGAK